MAQLLSVAKLQDTSVSVIEIEILKKKLELQSCGKVVVYKGRIIFVNFEGDTAQHIVMTSQEIHC